LNVPSGGLFPHFGPSFKLRMRGPPRETGFGGTLEARVPCNKGGGVQILLRVLLCPQEVGGPEFGVEVISHSCRERVGATTLGLCLCPGFQARMKRKSNTSNVLAKWKFKGVHEGFVPQKRTLPREKPAPDAGERMPAERTFSGPTLGGERNQSTCRNNSVQERMPTEVARVPKDGFPSADAAPRTRRQKKETTPTAPVTSERTKRGGSAILKGQGEN